MHSHETMRCNEVFIVEFRWRLSQAIYHQLMVWHGWEITPSEHFGIWFKKKLHQAFNTSRILVRNKIIDHSEKVGAEPMLLQLHLHSRLNTWFQGIGQRRLQDETRKNKFWDLVWFILEVWRYMNSCASLCTDTGRFYPYHYPYPII